MGWKERLEELKDKVRIIYMRGDIFERAMVRGIIDEAYDEVVERDRGSCCKPAPARTTTP